MYRNNALAIILFFVSHGITAQNSETDALFISDIHRTALTNNFAYEQLEYLTKSIGPRFSGTPQASAAVEYTFQLMNDMGMDTVWLQPCEVPRWKRGEPSKVKIVGSQSVGTVVLPSIALGNSIGTQSLGMTAEIVEVQSLDEVDQLAESLNGKIVFYNRPADPGQYRTFNAYGGAVDQRVFGASRAAKYGSIGVVVRSVTPSIDNIPHTGSMVYTDTTQKIPAIAISTKAADFLGQLVKKEKVRLNIRSGGEILSPVISYNVIGEIRGSVHPDEILLVGGHLDSWDVGEGAHDDGSGCVHALDVIHLLKELDYQPKRTIRCVMFMNEENGLKGALAYQEESDKKGEFHMAAIESDSGGFTPRSFSCDGDTSIFQARFQKMNTWAPLLEPYYIIFEKGGSGADINPLKGQMGMLMGLRPDSQRYFDYHHTATDTFDKVNCRELELGSAAMTSLVYLLDKYGL
ncbi:MAG: M28 family peptidase [Bacteroidia bacterium]|nr:M28 family peptidase [Bacteroidia bacterium]